MTTQQLIDFAQAFFNDCFETMKKKNADYTAGNKDALANFKFIEQAGIPGEVGLITRMGDKFMRLCGLAQGREAQVKDESIDDTCQDLAVYSMLLAAFRHDKTKI